MKFNQSLTNYLSVRPRFIFAILSACIAFIILPASVRPLTKLMIAWDVFSYFYIIFLFGKVRTTDISKIREVTKGEDESAKMVIFFVVCGCLFSTLVLLLELATAGQLAGQQKILHLTMSAITLFASWALLPMAFTMHYAHIFYYGEQQSDEPSLLFPDKIDTPSYWDFLYFSFTIAVACQTADVCVASQEMRKVVLLQSVISFLFNMTILGLSINICASLF
ncbi:MAG: DUF1345 domain-containing protein [Plesiomonas sp.]|uniref:DUF1345 domain-containing protein n=1 Tax=Plesiomonas sp. TaxID=2486279 RepID=UPI003F2A534B